MSGYVFPEFAFAYVAAASFRCDRGISLESTRESGQRFICINVDVALRMEFCIDIRSGAPNLQKDYFGLSGNISELWHCPPFGFFSRLILRSRIS
jgi:hypothetical protein